MPFITVEENVGKYLSNIDKKYKKERIHELLEVVEMLEYKQTKAKYLSGGQMQRVGIAKVLAKEPEILLLDEPYSHIDNFRKNALRRKLFNYIKNKGITCITASHDKEDVLGFADQLLVLKEGENFEFGTPTLLYQNSKNHYTKSLFDDCNFIDGRLLGNIEQSHQLLYPHELEICEKSELKVEVQNSYFCGNYYRIMAKHTASNATIMIDHDKPINKTQIIYLKPKLHGHI
jgi:ABC-type Fe3+/spermidine/putrescine transport system ATPase subunit